MHELSIALGIIDVASEEVERRNAARVTAVHLKVGALSGVDKDALLFSFDVASKDTTLEGAQLIIEVIPVIIFCSQCEVEQEIDSLQLFGCPVCGALASEVRQGKELEVVALEIEEMAEVLV